MLHFDLLRHRNKYVLIRPKLKLVVNCLSCQLLDLVVVEHASLNLLEIPSDQQVASRSHNTAFVATVRVIEPRWSEVACHYSILLPILRLDLQFFWRWFL